MNKIVTDNPDGNYETLCNFCRYVDGRAKFVETMDGENTDIYEFCRKECIKKCGVNIPEKDDGSLFDMMCFDCMTCLDCLNALLYVSACQAVELREHLKKYEESDVKSNNSIELVE